MAPASDQVPRAHRAERGGGARPRPSSTPIARGTRATGADAKLLNAQKKEGDAAIRATQKACDDYAASLQETTRMNETQSMALRSALRHDPELAQLHRALEQARRDLAELQAQARARRAQYATARREREEQQREDEAAPQEAPSRWRLGARERWEKARRARWAKVRAAVKLEQDARQAASPEGMAELRQKAQALRAEVKRLDQELAKRMAHAPDDEERLQYAAPSRPVRAQRPRGLRY